MISNASPLITYAKLNKLDLLNRCVGTITISEAVLREITQKESASQEAELVSSGVKEGAIVVKKLAREYADKAGQIQLIFKGIGEGEAETISLTLQEGQTEALIDDLNARGIAKLNGLTPIGSLRVLLIAFRKGIASEADVEKLFKQMIENKFWIGGSAIIRFLELFEKLKSSRRKQ